MDEVLNVIFYALKECYLNLVNFDITFFGHSTSLWHIFLGIIFLHTLFGIVLVVGNRTPAFRTLSNSERIGSSSDSSSYDMSEFERYTLQPIPKIKK